MYSAHYAWHDRVFPQAQAERHRDLEREIFQEGMASVRQMVEQEVADMRRMVNVGEPADSHSEPADGAGDSLATITEEDDEDLFDINALRLKLSTDDGPIPVEYLLSSPLKETQAMSGWVVM